MDGWRRSLCRQNCSLSWGRSSKSKLCPHEAALTCGCRVYNHRMSKFDDLEKQARALYANEKAALVRVLIDELDPRSDPGVDQLWLEEARRRYAAYRSGEMHSIPGDDAMARARSRLR